jgi:beta-N-acetylhexosaminidase
METDPSHCTVPIPTELPLPSRSATHAAAPPQDAPETREVEPSPAPPVLTVDPPPLHGPVADSVHTQDQEDQQQAHILQAALRLARLSSARLLVACVFLAVAIADRILHVLQVLQRLQRLAQLRSSKTSTLRIPDLSSGFHELSRLLLSRLRLHVPDRPLALARAAGRTVLAGGLVRAALACRGSADRWHRLGLMRLGWVHHSRSTTGCVLSIWLRYAIAVLGLTLLAVRAGLASTSFMAPGGEILGWSQVPGVHCMLCQLSPTVNAQSTKRHDLTLAQYAGLLVQRLPLDQQLGQLLLVQFPGRDATPDAVQMVNAQGVGAVISFAANIRSADQVRAMTSELQQVAPIPLIITVDQEGGGVNRFRAIIGPVDTAASLATPQQVRARGEQDATLLHAFGYNLNLAPVVDVDGSANPQLYGRTFGAEPQHVATMAGAYLAGLQDSGAVTGCLKHFPGLGATTTDPHQGLPVLRRSRADWERIDLAPYRLLLAQHDIRAIMVSHEMIPAVDSSLPTSLSPAIIDGTLRGELGYQGVVITDSLYMGALASHWSVAQASVLAIKAGADMVMGAQDPRMVAQIKDALRQAVASGELTQERIAASVQRILTLKIGMGLIPLPQPTQPTHGRIQGLSTDAGPLDMPRRLQSAW